MKKGHIRATIAALLLALLVLGTGTEAQALETWQQSSGSSLKEKWAKAGQPETGLVIYEGSYTYSAGLYRPIETTAYGLKDSGGNEVLPLEYAGFQYVDGIILAIHYAPSTHICAYDATGRKLFEDLDVLEIKPDQDSGMFRVCFQGERPEGERYVVNKYYMYDRNFNPITKDYEIILALGDGYYTARKDRKMGIYKLNYGLVIPCQYEDVGYIGGDLFSVAKDKQYYQGVLDLNNSQMLPFQFDYVESHLNGYFLVGKFEDRAYTIDALASVGWQKWMTMSGEGTLFGVAESSGNLVVPMEHESLDLVEENGQTVVHVNKWTGKYRVSMAGASTGYGKIYEYDYTINIPTSSTPSQPVQPAAAFSDVPASAYYANAVTWAIDKSITNGTGANTFSPDKKCSAAEILTFIWRAKGQPEPTISNPFSDVSPSDYYYKAALWAYENGIILGTEFYGSVDCNRVLAVLYLWRAAGSPAPASAASFSDVPAREFYADAVSWAVEQGITSGTSADTFSPDETCTRGQIAAFLYRAYAD